MPIMPPASFVPQDNTRSDFCESRCMALCCNGDGSRLADRGGFLQSSSHGCLAGERPHGLPDGRYQRWIDGVHEARIHGHCWVRRHHGTPHIRSARLGKTVGSRCIRVRRTPVCISRIHRHANCDGGKCTDRRSCPSGRNRQSPSRSIPRWCRHGIHRCWARSARILSWRVVL